MNLLDLTYAGLARICSMSTWSVLLFKITVLLAVAWLIHSAKGRGGGESGPRPIPRSSGLRACRW